MLLSIVLTYALFFQGFLGGFVSVSSPAESSLGVSGVICSIEGLAHDDDGDRSSTQKIAHQHCALCLALQQTAAMPALASDANGYSVFRQADQPVRYALWRAKALKSLYPPPQQSRGPPLNV